MFTIILVWCFKILTLYKRWKLCLFKLFSAIMGSANGKILNPTAYAFRANEYEEVLYDFGQLTVPLPRSGHRIVCDSKNLYSFGGYNPDDYGLITAVNSWAPLFKELWRFNFATKEWTEYDHAETLPDELASNAVLRMGDMLLVYGGTGYPFGHSNSNKISICNLNCPKDAGLMKTLPTSGAKPVPQYGQALIHHKNYIYSIGGTEGFVYSCDVHRLDLNECTWTLLNTLAQMDPSQGRYRHELAFDGTFIYMFGGGTASVVFDFEIITCYDVRKNSFLFMETIGDPNQGNKGTPKARRCHGLNQIDTPSDGIQVYISGGYDGHTIFNDLWRLSLKTMRWELLENSKLPRPTYFHSTALTPEGKLYVFGGIHDCDEVGSRRSNQVHSIWLCIPALSEMCWEAVLHYTKRINGKSKESFVDLGVPKRFIDRIE